VGWLSKDYSILMRNRWFHKPLFHFPSHDFEKKATWLELFYDLIFVAAFIQLGNGLSDHVNLDGFFGFSAIFTTLWVAWTGFTFYSNRYIVNDFLHRIIVFFQMFAVGVMAITSARVLDGMDLAFTLAYVAAQGVVAILYFRSWRQQSIGRAYSKYWGIVFAVGALMWLLSLWVAAPVKYFMWAAAVLVIIVSPFSPFSIRLQQQFPIDLEHIIERYGLLTIIVLGESFVKVLSSLSNNSFSPISLFQAGFTLLITCSVWWVYFDDVAGSKIKEGKFNPIIWIYSHIPLQIGITALGVAIKKAIAFPLFDPVSSKYGWLLAFSLGLVFISTALVDSVTQRRQSELSDAARINVRLFSGVLLWILALVSHTLVGWWYITLVTGIAVSQVVFDMMMAPFEVSHETPHNTVPVAQLVKKKMSKESSSIPKVRLDPSGFIRKGTPVEYRADIYFHLMNGSWRRVFISIIVVFILINCFFAGLYILVPDSISSVRPSNFADAFFFSVQTMSTIGYGVMAPQSSYGHIIVVIEALVSIIGIALVTGLMFAKASRPKSSVIFSNKLVIHNRNGQKILMLRAGNARGNDVIDASMKLTALIDEISDEGDHLRRVTDLKLIRSYSPFFSLSWSVMHPIDEASPLHGVDLDDPECNVVALLATLTGHDGTYGQTIYARHEWQIEDIVPNHKFVDVINQLEDGRLMIDYDSFHNVAPTT
jgi:inward rectifier potassium channel